MNDSSRSEAPRSTAGRPDPVQHIAELRANLLGGRGRGASQEELEAHQRQRVVYGGLPITVARERDSLVDARARRAPVTEPQVDAARRLAELAVKPSSTQERPRARRKSRNWLAGVACALALGGALIGFVIGSRRIDQLGRVDRPCGPRPSPFGRHSGSGCRANAINCT